MASGNLKILTLSHSIKICCALNKFNTARKLIQQTMAYQDEVDENVNIDLLLNQANYFLNVESSTFGINSYYVRIEK